MSSARKFAISRDSPTPVYEQIAEHLRRQIASGRFASGAKLPGIKPMARNFGVNHLTMRQALLGLEAKGLISMELGRGTFVRDAARQPLRVALILPNLNESSSLISGGVQEALGASPAAVSIFHYDQQPEREIEDLSRLASEQCDGAIVFPSLAPSTLKPLLQKLIDGYPIVFLDRIPRDVPCWSVASDNFRGGRLAAAHLIGAGCHRLACAGVEIGTVQERLDGFIREINDRGGAVEHDLIHVEKSENYRIEDVIDRWFALKNPPDGIFCPNDFRASMAVRRLGQLGRRVPRQVKVVGFDNLGVADLATPPLTTIAQDFKAIGRRAARLLSEMVATPPEKRFGARRELVPVELVARESA